MPAGPTPRAPSRADDDRPSWQSAARRPRRMCKTRCLAPRTTGFHRKYLTKISGSTAATRRGRVDVFRFVVVLRLFHGFFPIVGFLAAFGKKEKKAVILKCLYHLNCIKNRLIDVLKK